MRTELKEQVKRVNEISQRVDAVTGEDHDDYGDIDGSESERLTGGKRTEAAIEKSCSKNDQLNTRLETLRRRMLTLSDKQLSAQEVACAEEVRRLNSSIGSTFDVTAPVTPNALLHLVNSAPEAEDCGGSRLEGSSAMLANRFRQVEELHSTVTEQAKQVVERRAEDASQPQTNGLGGSFRRQQLARVMGLLERETALVEGVSERLRRLGGLE